jgi:hypothetical protein
MNITKPGSKPTEPVKEVKVVNVSKAQLAAHYAPQWGNLCPMGKYKDKSYKWIKDNDPKYIQWIMEKQLHIDWSLYVMKDTKPVVKKNTLYTNEGVWMSIYEISNEPPYKQCEWV